MVSIIILEQTQKFGFVCQAVDAIFLIDEPDDDEEDGLTNSQAQQKPHRLLQATVNWIAPSHPLYHQYHLQNDHLSSPKIAP